MKIEKKPMKNEKKPMKNEKKTMKMLGAVFHGALNKTLKKTLN